MSHSPDRKISGSYGRRPRQSKMPLAVRQTSLNKHSIWVLITRSGIEIYVGN